MHTKSLSGNFKEIDYLRDLRLNGRIILRLLSKSAVRVWTEFIWLRIGHALSSMELVVVVMVIVVVMAVGIVISVSQHLLVLHVRRFL
jgi:hypothetical protein